MKKLLLSLTLLSFFGNLSAQELSSQNFNSLTVGNVGTDITGVTPTNDIYTTATNGTAPTTGTNAGNDNFQIVANDVTHVNALQITGTNGDKGSRTLWIGDFPTAWDFRDVGNNIVEAEFDLYTGTTGTSYNRMGLYIYDETRTKVLGGFSFDTHTLVISGVGYYTSASAPIGNYLFYLGTGATNITLPAATWVRLGVSFNMTTGQVRWKGPGINGQVIGAAIAVNPDRISFVSTSGTTTTIPIVTNTAAASVLFDNFIARASLTDTLLGVDQVDEMSFAIYPNPASTVINVSNKSNSAITSIGITDVNGRIVKQQAYNLSQIQVDISDLSAGIYIMNITSGERTATRKIIKN